MKRTLIAGLVVLLIVVAGLTIWWAVDNNNPSRTNETPASQQTPEAGVDERVETIQYQGEDGKTALELLQENTEVSMQGEGEMAFVTTINGVEASGTEFWAFLVNGEMASMGAGSYETSSSDTITWELQPIDPGLSESAE